MKILDLTEQRDKMMIQEKARKRDLVKKVIRRRKMMSKKQMNKNKILILNDH